MKIKVYFKSGETQIFIVDVNITVIDFTHMAHELGGAILKIEFL